MESRQRPTRINIELLQYKEPFVAWCERRGQSPSEVMRQVVAQLLAKGDEAAAHELANGESDRRVKVRPKVPLTESEAAAAQAAAEREGLTLPRWIVGLVRSYLTRAPQFSQKELELLGQSNLQLLSIGRNLNQIAKALNTSPHDRRAYRVEMIEALQGKIKEHTRAVSAAVAANVDRWRIK